MRFLLDLESLRRSRESFPTHSFVRRYQKLDAAQTGAHR
jgi:hypothetical protein